jgi:hypothetical protein
MWPPLVPVAMRHHPLLFLTPLMLTLAVCTPVAAAGTVVAQLERPSTVRAYAGIQVLSAYDGSSYRLAVLRHGRMELLPVAPSQAPFDVDIGPGRTGRPQLVYTRCRVERPDVAFGRNDSESCDLVTYTVDGRSAERAVRGASTPDGNEFAPTLWKGRIAFARKVPGRERPLVLLRDLSAPRSRPSLRLPSITRATSTRGILELELSGRHLAQIVFSAGRTEVRLVDVRAGRARRLAGMGVGEGGQYFAGIGFADGYLAWATQWITGGGALRPGIYRYRLSTGELVRAPHPRDVFSIVGLAPADQDTVYITDSSPTDDGCGGEPQGVGPPRHCQVVRTGPLRFRPVRPGAA